MSIVAAIRLLKRIGLKPDLQRHAFFCRSGFNPTAMFDAGYASRHPAEHKTAVDTAMDTLAILHASIESDPLCLIWIFDNNNGVRLASNFSTTLMHGLRLSRSAFGY